MTRILHRAFACIAALGLAGAAVPAAADGLRGDPLARFEEPVCPGIIGLPVDNAVAMVERIRANAASLGLRTAPEDDCAPNLIVSFLADGQAYLQQLDAQRGYLFESLSRADKRALLAATGPARAWITTETRTRDGLQVGRQTNLVDVPRAGMWSAHSLIYVPTRRDITAAMVLIDRDAIAGLSTAQLADYATLVGLADYVPQAAAGVPSIQHLFDSGAPAPAALTEFDRAYLDRLYSSIPNLPAYARLQGLAGLAEAGE